MFLLVPLIFIIGSAAGIIVIVYRKLPYLKKLTPENHEVGDTLVHDLYPEIFAWFDQVKWHEVRQYTLVELEKFLRKLRLATLKIEHLSDALIKKVRHTHLSGHIEQMIAEEKVPEPAAMVEPVKDPQQALIEEFKAQEQKLIIEIAQNPKDPRLYEVLGDLYLKLENHSDAREAYEAALSLEPTNEVLARKYSKLLHPKTEAVA